MEKLLSVVVPIYGVEKYLRQCVDSILDACTGISSEVILVDDGGTDGCPTICDSYAQHDGLPGQTSDIRVVHKKNGGYGSAVNAGFDMAKGEWISIVEPDDWVEQGMYRTLLSGIGGDVVDIIKADFQYVLPSGVFPKPDYGDGMPPSGVFRIDNYPALLCRHPSIWSAIYRRKFLERYNIRMKEVPGAGWVDNLFLVQTMCQARGIRFLPQIVYNYRSTGDSFSELKGKWEVPYSRIQDELAWFRSNATSSEVMCSRYRAYLHYLWLMSNCALTNKEKGGIIVQAVQEVSCGLDWGAIAGAQVMSKMEKMTFWMYRHMPRFAILRIKNRLIGRMASVFLRIVGLFVLR